jgi:multidrug transporter EmrE-like cation transporter
MDLRTGLAMLALGGAIVADVAGTFVIERAAQLRERWLWVTAVVLLLASLTLFALALGEISTAVAESLFIAIGSAAVALLALRRGERISTRKAAALGLLVLGVVVLQMGAGHA